MKNSISFGASKVHDAIAELQAIKRSVVVGGSSTVDVVLPGVTANATLLSVVGIDGDNAVLADSVKDVTDQCSIAPVETAITGITLTAGLPVQVLAVGHGFVSGQYAQFGGTVVGTDTLNNKGFLVDVVDADNVTLRGTNGSNYTAWTSGGTLISQRASLSMGLDLTTYMLLVDTYNEPIDGPAPVA